HPVVAKAEYLVLLRAQDRVQEDTTKSDFPTTLVAQSIINDQPHFCAGNQACQDLDGQQATDFIPIPSRLAEQAKGSGMVALLGLAAGFPNTADRTSAQADNPACNHHTEHGKRFLSK